MKLGTLKNNSAVAVTKNGFIKLSELNFNGSLLDLIKKGDDELEKISSTLKTKNNPQKNNPQTLN